MGITVTERWSGDSLTQGSPDARNFSLAATREFDVTADTNSYTSFDVAGLMSDPVLRGAFPQDVFLRCNNIQIRKTAPFMFLVSVSYFTQGTLGGGPLSVPPSIAWGSLVTEEEIPYDINGNGICTVLGEPFDPPPRTPVYDRILRIQRNLANYDENWAGLFRNAVNSAPFFGFPTGTVRTVALDGQSVLDDTFSYWSVTGEFQIRKAPPNSSDQYAWWTFVQAKGLYVKKSGKVVLGLDDNGNPTTVPVYHNTSTGAQLGRGDPIQYYKFQMLPTADLNAIGLI